jgi:hypothetical protein
VTKRQRRLVLEWLFAGVLLVSLIVLDGDISGHWSWAIWILLGTTAFALSYGQPRATFETSSERINRIANTYPFVKLWLVICGLAIAATVVLVTNSTVRIEEIFGFRIVLIALLVVVGPIVWIAQRELYVAYGHDDDEI